MMAILTRKRAKLGVPETSAPTADLTQEDTTSPAQMAAERATAENTQVEKLSWRQRRQQMKALSGKFDSYPHLLALKPKERYVFRSDYFEVDSSVACVLAFFHDEAANDGFSAFWGINRIPDGLADGVTAVVLEQIVRMSDKWIDQNTKQSERLDKLDADEQAEAGTTSSRRKAAKVSTDLASSIAEIQDGASYLSVHNRLLLKASDLATLEDSIERITRLYIDRFGTLKVAPYAGEQRQELSGLLRPNEKKRGKGFHFTSTELAGSYSLVTNGLNDRTGEYVGYMVGDVNNSAVIVDANRYDHHVVVADGTLSSYLSEAQISDMWCSKISQSALLSNHSVVHLVLDGADLDKLGPKFEGLTSRVDLNSGDVNMFEMFGDQDDELVIFPAQMQKLVLMFEQLYETADGGVGSIIRNELEKTATQFYVDQRMWSRNAKENRSRLRVVGIPHDQVPRLQMFASYLDTAHKALLNSAKNDPDQLRAYNVLSGVAKNLLDNNGDLFNNATADAVDGIREARRVVYDFSKLMRRGRGVAMAQLVNIVGFAIGKLKKGDTVIIHGTENIDSRVKAYIEGQFTQLHQRGGRVVYSYNDIDKMLADSDFNKFDAADYTILGTMRDKTVIEYQRQMAQQIPRDLAQLITRRGENLSYLRRGVSNVVFELDLPLGINPNREKQRRAMQLAAAKAEESAKFAAIMESKPVPGANMTGLGNTGESQSNRPDKPSKASRRSKKAGQRQLKADGGPGRSAAGTPTERQQQQLVPTRAPAMAKQQRGRRSTR